MQEEPKTEEKMEAEIRVMYFKYAGRMLLVATRSWKRPGNTFSLSELSEGAALTLAQWNKSQTSDFQKSTFYS